MKQEPTAIRTAIEAHIAVPKAVKSRANLMIRIQIHSV